MATVSPWKLFLLPIFFGILIRVQWAVGHEQSIAQYQQTRVALLAKAAQLAENPQMATQARQTCRLAIELLDAATDRPLAGMVRVTRLDNGKAVKLASQIHRVLNWYALPARTTVTVPRTQLKIEAFHGIETEMRVVEVDGTATAQAAVRIPLKRFFHPRAMGLASGNTHLHLMDRTHSEALRYLKVVPEADGLDLVFLSHLRRLPDETKYISNQIVENSFQEESDLQKLSQGEIVYANGEEHRHNFGRGGEGYGHVMLLDLRKLIRPVSIGPGIMGGKGTDGIPLQRGIQTARHDGATVIWCHNTRGYEDIPNWLAGLLDAQNINDGSTGKSYKESFYKYLNLGLKVPFSTGTDWSIYDFCRVYVPVAGKLTSKKWLNSLAAGKTFITNSALLEFSLEGKTMGDTISLAGTDALRVRGSGYGRGDFRGLELIHNGAVVHTAASRPVDGHFIAEMDYLLKINSPGWVALRIPLAAGKNEFDHDQFAHTSPIYLEMAGQRIFRAEIAKSLIEEIEQNIDAINRQGKFDNNRQWLEVMNVHRQGIEILRRRIQEAAREAP